MCPQEKYVGVGLSFKSSDVDHCSLDFFVIEMAKLESYSSTLLNSVMFWRVHVWQWSRLCVTCVLANHCLSRVCFYCMCLCAWFFFFFSFFFCSPHWTDAFSFSMRLFPTSQSEPDGRASPALLGINVMSDWILHLLTITALSAVGVKKTWKRVKTHTSSPAIFVHARVGKS